MVKKTKDETMEKEALSITGKLGAIQLELHAPKGQRNTFANFNYRSCEDILTAVKPLLGKYELTLAITDEMVFIGERHYVKATVKLADFIGDCLETNGYAREPLAKKGMDESQITGAASSYARKYGLNGMFCIDDTKDADTMDNSGDEKPKVLKKAPPKTTQKKTEPVKKVEPPKGRKPDPNSKSMLEKAACNISGEFHNAKNTIEMCAMAAEFSGEISLLPEDIQVWLRNDYKAAKKVLETPEGSE